MLVVVEGQSAVGKTTFVQSFPTAQIVGEVHVAIPPELGRRQLDAYPYFIEANAQRWMQLLEAENTYGVAYADTDVLKLYYEWALVAVGELDQEIWLATWSLARAAMAAGCYGFADHVLYLTASPETLTARKLGDTTRRRGSFALHVRLGNAMQAYYATLEHVRPGMVHWLDTERDVERQCKQILAGLTAHRYDRYDVTVLDRLQHDLLARLAAATQWE